MQPRPGLRAVAALAAFFALSAPGAAQEATLIGALNMAAEHPLLGGLSALEMAEDGASMVALSDRGAVFRADISRDDTGQITRVDLIQAEELLGRNGRRGPWAARDSEGLAMAEDGTLFLSFEGDHRVARYLGDGISEALPPHPDFAALQANAALEALAIDAAGQLYAVPEDPGSEVLSFPVYRFADGSWDRTLSVPRIGRFLAVGADFDDLGRFYLLERDFSLFFGFAARIRRFTVTETGLANEVTLLTTRYGQFSNLEGLSLWRNAAGRIVASMVSDDNFSPLLPTQLVEFMLLE
jgi:hypothetical protein